MKKTLLTFVSALTAVSHFLFTMPVSASNAENTALLYFSCEDNEKIENVSDSLILIDENALKNGDITLNLNVYVKDDARGICALSAKWRCDSDYISLENIVDPKASLGETKEYSTSSGKSFVTDMTPFPFASIDEESGSMTIKGTPDIHFNPDKNSMGCSYAPQNNITTSTPFSYLGQASDEYAFSSFDAVIDAEIPNGIYEIVFSTKDNIEGDNSVRSHGLYLSSEQNETYSFVPKTQNLTIVVHDGILLGDSDLDGFVNASDASKVLRNYAITSTGGSSEFDEIQTIAADVNKDGAVDASDASKILAYYAYTSTGGTGSIEDFIG